MKHMQRRHLAGFVVVALLSTQIASQRSSAQGGSPGLPSASAESLGFSPQRLARFEANMQRYVDENRVAGLITLIARRGKIVEFKAYGQADREQRTPMRTDTIFRMASMTKPVVNVAAMILMEDGKLLLSDPVSKFIPSFKNTTVAVPPPPGSPANTPYTVVPAKREITIRDLLVHTSGYGYGNGIARDQYKAANVFMYYLSDRNETVGEVVERLAKLPADAQPGERFVYGYNSDILGYVVEKASGMNLDEFFRMRIFEPLKMVDSYFYLPKEKASRLAAVYTLEEGALKRAPAAGIYGQGAFVEGPRKFFSGGAGMLSTASDYARFAQMLLNGGQLDGVRLLSPKTVELMTANLVGTKYESSTATREGKGFGITYELTLQLTDRPGSPGDYGWLGAYFTRFWVDPAEQLVAVLMTQMTPVNTGGDLHDKFRTQVYQALVDSNERRTTSLETGGVTAVAVR